MELREQLREQPESLQQVSAPKINQFYLLGKEIACFEQKIIAPLHSPQVFRDEEQVAFF